jgi:hypothetical protein
VRAKNIFLIFLVLGLSFVFLANTVNAEQVYLAQGEKVTSCTGKSVELLSVKSSSAMIKYNDGRSYVISDKDRYIADGLWTKGIEFFADYNSVKLSMDCKDVEYDNGEGYFNPCGSDWRSEKCGANDPDWVWEFKDISSNEPTFYLYNDFTVNGMEDTPIGIGECYDFPCGIYKICLDSTNDVEYMDLDIEFESDTDLSYINPVYTSVPTFYIHTSEDDTLRLKADKLNETDNDIVTSKVWLFFDGRKIWINYEDNSNDIARAGQVMSSSELNGFMQIDYGETKGTNIVFDLDEDSLYIRIIDDDNDFGIYSDDLLINMYIDDGQYASLGRTIGESEGQEIRWGRYFSKDISTKDEDHMTQYGIIVKDPKSNGASDEVNLEIPDDQVKAVVSIRDSNDNIINNLEKTIPLGVGINDPNVEGTFDYENTLTSSTTYDEYLIFNKYSNGTMIQTSLTGSDDDYGLNVFMEVVYQNDTKNTGTDSFRYKYVKNGALDTPDTFEFLGYDMTVSDYGYNNRAYWISVSDYLVCGAPISKPKYVCFAGEPCYFSGADSFDSEGDIKEYSWDFGEEGYNSAEQVRSDDGEMDEYLGVMKDYDDTGISTLMLKRSRVDVDLEDYASTKLFVYGRVTNCANSRYEDTGSLRINYKDTIKFNPCEKFTKDFKWQSFDIPHEYLQEGSSNTFRIMNWGQTTIDIGYDTDTTNKDRSVMRKIVDGEELIVSKDFEAMMYLEIYDGKEYGDIGFYKYAKAGDYNVELTVTDNSGDNDTKILPVKVINEDILYNNLGGFYAGSKLSMGYPVWVGIGAIVLVAGFWYYIDSTKKSKGIRKRRKRRK